MSSSRVIVITGGARGIGAAIATRFADDGATVVAADLDVPTAAEADRRVHYEQVDVASVESVEALFARVAEAQGRVDVLVNNAGIWFRRSFRELTVEEWDQVVAVNLRGVFLCTRAALNLLEASEGSSIVNVGSQAGLSVSRGQGLHYHATKAAVSHLTKALAFEFGPLGIRVNCVAPGATPPDPSWLPPEFLAQIPLGRSAVPTDMTGAVAFLASPDAAYITGQTLLVNGGAVAFL